MCRNSIVTILRLTLCWPLMVGTVVAADISVTSTFVSAGPVPTCDATAGGGLGSYATPDGQPRIWAGAADYCAGLGMRLPLKDELLELYNAYPNNEITTVCGWPSTSYGYWTSSSTTPGFHTVVLLDNGAVTEVANTVISAVACVR